jgi:hypothetical protein
MTHIPTQPPEWYEHPQIKYMKNIDPNISSMDQFYAVKSFDWSGEKAQVDLFCDLLKTIDSSNPSIIELGSAGVGGSFYSVLFEKWFDKKCTIINVDPRKEMLEEVKTYWKDLHLVNAKLYHGYVGIPKHYQALPDFVTEKTPFLRIKNMLEENGIEKLDILHADIQGSEISVCEEMKSDGILNKIRYFFISTHSGEGANTYHPCVELFSNSINCKFHFSDPLNGGWGDGLIVVENLEWNNI